MTDEEHKVMLEVIADRISDCSTLLQLLIDSTIGVIEKLNQNNKTLGIISEQLLKAEIKNREIVVAICEIGKLLGKELIEKKGDKTENTDQFMHLSRYVNHALVYGVEKVDCVDDNEIERVTCPYCLERFKKDKGLSDDFNPIKKA